MAWFHLSFENITPVTIIWNRNGDVMVSVLSSTAEEHEFDSWSGQTKHKKVCVALPLRSWCQGERTKTGWLGTASVV